MIENKQCSFVCSLRTRTLTLLWIVMIGCCFHMLYVNFHQQQSVTLDNQESNVNHNQESNVDHDNSAQSAENSDEFSREKRSSDIFEDITNLVSNSFNTVVSATAQIADSSISAVSNISSSIINGAGNMSSKVNSDARNVTDHLLKVPGNIAGSVLSGVSKIAANFTDPITNHVINQVKESRVVNNISKEIAKDIVGDIDNRVDKRLNAFESRFQTFFKNIIRFFIRIWSMLGFSSSALGIYGVHRNVPKCLTFSIFFFNFSIVSEFLIMLEINVDSSIERKMFLMSELAGIDWKGVIEDLIVVNLGIFCFIGLSFYFAIIVKKCRNSMLKKDGVESPT